MRKFLQSSFMTENDLVWFVYTSSIGYLQKYVEKFEYVVQFYEFEDFALKRKNRLLYSSYDVQRFMSKAKALIHCEYNRAVITNGLYGINKHFFVLPNKPYDSGLIEPLSPPDDVSKLVEDVKRKVEGKKVILYQGIFNSSERRLDEFCEAMSLLPDNYVFIAMGGGGGYFEEIQKKYNSNKIIYIPFVRPPHHLLITKLATIGILTYHPANHSYVGVINPLYCAPNKIFEYGKFGIPMIANDVPGLRLIFESYNCGKTISYPLTPQKIANTIMDLDKDYEKMSEGSHEYYNSVDVEGIVRQIIS